MQAIVMRQSGQTSQTPQFSSPATAGEMPASIRTVVSTRNSLMCDTTAQTVEVTAYPPARQAILVTIGLLLAGFLVTIDRTILATAIPKITDLFDSVDQVGWYVSSYAITMVAFQMFFGKLYSLYPRKCVFMSALALFELGSTVCGAAPSSAAFILGRSIAGVGSAGIFTGGTLILIDVVPLQQRGLVFGLMSAVQVTGTVVGPYIAGALVDRLSWRWCFYINLPIGAVTVLFVGIFYEATRSGISLTGKKWKDKLEHFDIYGTLIFLPMVVALVLALQNAGSAYEWRDPRVIAELVISGVLLVIFAGIQIRMQDKGTVPPRLVRKRTIWSGALFGISLNAALSCFAYYLPIWFQAIKQATATKAAVLTLPLTVTTVLTTILAGWATTALGYCPPFAITSTVLMSIGAGLLTTLGPDSGYPRWFGYQAVFGIGVGVGIQAPTLAIQGSLDSLDLPLGLTFFTFCQTMGLVLSVCITQNVFINGLVHRLGPLLTDTDRSALDPNLSRPSIDPILLNGVTELMDIVPSDRFAQAQQAYSSALKRAFYVAAGSAALSIVGAVCFKWESIRPHGGQKVHHDLPRPQLEASSESDSVNYPLSLIEHRSLGKSGSTFDGSFCTTNSSTPPSRD